MRLRLIYRERVGINLSKSPYFRAFFFFSAMIGKVSHAINREKQKLLPFRNDIAIIRVVEHNIYDHFTNTFCLIYFNSPYR